MESLPTLIYLIYGFVSLTAFIKGVDHVFKKKNPYGNTFTLFWLGIFVWGDALIFGLFWIIISCIAYLLNDWLLFLLINSVFWLVRSIVETVYWLNRQFLPNKDAHRVFGYQWIKSDAILFIYQTIWQCLIVVFLIATIYSASLWLR